MKAGKSETNNFYRTDIVNNVIGLEEKRQVIIKKIIWEQILPSVLLFILGLIFVAIRNVGCELLIGIVCLISFYLWWFYDAVLQDQIKSFKASVISGGLNFFGRDFNYSLQEKISKSELITSKLIEEEINRYTGEGYVEGQINGINLKFSKVIAESRVESEVRDLDWDTLFEGVLFVVDFKEEFDCDLIIKTDTAGRIFENLNQSMQKTAGIVDNPFGEGGMLREVDSEFGDKFKIIGKDKKKARKFLTKKLKKNILRLIKEVNYYEQQFPETAGDKIIEQEVFLSIIGSKFYAGIPFEGEKTFTPRIFSPYRSDFKDLKYYFDILRNILNIIQNLRANKNL